MYLGDKVYDFHGTIGAGGTLEPNSGSYWSAATVDPGYCEELRKVQGIAHSKSLNHVPNKVLMNVYSSNTGTAYVYENEHLPGDSDFHDPVESGSIDLKGGTQAQFETVVDAEYFQIKVENGGASPSTIGVTVRMKDEFK